MLKSMEKLQKLSASLNKRGYETEIFNDRSILHERILELIRGHTVGCGSCRTLEHLELHKLINRHARKIFPHIPGGAGEDGRSALTADFYFTSANAVSMDGHIVNIDGTGNRVAATCFGPGRVIYLIGSNKITDALDEAIKRAKVAAVKLAKHFNRKTPCVKTGKCEDCLPPDCICSVTVIHRRKPNGAKISVFLINEALWL